MRSKLFVPASRPELFGKALSGAADALSFDLEDAVALDMKAQARGILRDLLRSESLLGSAKTIIVRVNALDTPHFQDDVMAVVQPGLQMLNLPKPESVADVLAAVRAIAQAEQANGVSIPVQLLLNVESPKALRMAHELAAAHPRVLGLQLGLGDLFEPLAIGRHARAAIEQAMFSLRMAAGEAGVFAYDSAFADVADSAGYRAEAEMARDLGFLGKTCIHPSQVGLANAVFRPSDKDIAHALKVIAAASAADAKGVGAFMVDGRMIDRPFVERARVIVASATRSGLLPT